MAAREELVYATAEDGIELAGVMIAPLDRAIHSVSIVWIHGNAAAFYDRPYIEVGRAVAALGFRVISANTRGHDIASMQMQWHAGNAMPSASGGGGGWERIEEAPRDLAAWIEVAGGGAGGRVVLAGHSAGAQKVVLYGAERPDDARVAGIVLASPDLHGLRIPGELEAAQALVAAGHEMEVLPAQPYAPWYRQSAQTVVSRAAAVERIWGDPGRAGALAALRVPVLAFYGAHDLRGDAELEAIRAALVASPRIETQLIENAGHFYTGYEAEVAQVITQWTATLR